MLIQIYKSLYKGRDAITLESSEIKVQFLPGLGGKMSSLLYKKTSREFLTQGKNEEYKILKYDGTYVESECSGFDDCFPTIDPCYYNEYPWAGVRIPDHGEVCGLCWDYKIDDNELYMYVYGVRLPYKLEKWVRYEDDQLLTIQYKATNLSGFDMDFLWAAHPMINAEEGGEILIPFKEEQDITCVLSFDENFGIYGDSMKWPVANGRDGKTKRLDITSKRNEQGNNYKIFFNSKVNAGWCGYKYRDGTVVLLEFPENKVPYLGIWVNEGSAFGFHNIALEPCTGAFDSINAAKAHKLNSVLRAKEEYDWSLNFCIKQ